MGWTLPIGIRLMVVRWWQSVSNEIGDRLRRNSWKPAISKSSLLPKHDSVGNGVWTWMLELGRWYFNNPSSPLKKLHNNHKSHPRQKYKDFPGLVTHISCLNIWCSDHIEILGTSSKLNIPYFHDISAECKSTPETTPKVHTEAGSVDNHRFFHVSMFYFSGWNISYLSFLHFLTRQSWWTLHFDGRNPMIIPWFCAQLPPFCGELPHSAPHASEAHKEPQRPRKEVADLGRLNWCLDGIVLDRFDTFLNLQTGDS